VGSILKLSQERKLPEDKITGWGLWRLRPGDKIRITEGGPIRQVTRVSISCAYYDVITENTYEVFDRDLGEEKEITRKSKKVDYISPYSYVEMIERGDPSFVPAPVVPPITKRVESAPKDLPPIRYAKVRRKR
jgi:hypothetical protein